jgi:hypothetical protein
VATRQEVQAAMSGFPRALMWINFRQVTSSPSPPHQAQSSSSYTVAGGWRVSTVDGAFRVTALRITVTTNTAASWAVAAARGNADLLRHEQGHYDITGLVARDLAIGIVDLSLDIDAVTAMADAGNTTADHQRYAQREFQRDIDDLGRQATTLLNRLQTNPMTRADGLYDRQTRHGRDKAAQLRRDGLFSQAKLSTRPFRLMLSMAGVL